jgi:hypothetical protein
MIRSRASTYFKDNTMILRVRHLRDEDGTAVVPESVVIETAKVNGTAVSGIATPVTMTADGDDWVTTLADTVSVEEGEVIDFVVKAVSGTNVFRTTEQAKVVVRRS